MKDLDFLAVGNRIRSQREFLGYTREYVAEQLDVSVNFCRDIEIGAKGMSIQTLARMSDTLKLSLDYIVFGKVPESAISPLSLMLASCPPAKRKYVDDIVKNFLLAVE
jgi:transcriptional regulator with XRE-family HTH domain